MKKKLSQRFTFLIVEIYSKYQVLNEISYSCGACMQYQRKYSPATSVRKPTIQYNVTSEHWQEYLKVLRVSRAP